MLRTDAAPLTRRVPLPAAIRAVRWVAVSPARGTGWVPGPTDYYDVYAYLRLDADAWGPLNAATGRPGARGAIRIPAPVADLLVPPAATARFQRSAGETRAEGVVYDRALRARDAHTDVVRAVRVGDTLLVQLRVP